MPSTTGRESSVVNDIHSRLNETTVAECRFPASVEAVQDAVRDAGRRGLAVSIAGGRHAMGGQQFGAGTVLIDMSRLDRVLAFDAERGTVDVEAGIQWPELLEWLTRTQAGSARPWGFRQKQTGADRLSIGGALAANVHGRGLAFPPIVSDVVHFTLVDAEGHLVRCSRTENAALFGLAIGGYGLFGVIAEVRLQLYPRIVLERVVEVADVDQLAERFAQRIDDGFLYGDFQFSTDSGSEDFLRRGVFATYRRAPDGAVVPATHRELSEADWRQLYWLAHTDKALLYRRYVDFYLSTNGQLYWSDAHQMSAYVDHYHEEVDQRLGAAVRGSEMITEIYVPRTALRDFLARVREDFLAHGTNLVYGTVRLIRRDSETFLAWAREDFACVVFNLHVDHDGKGIDRAQREFQRLIDRGLELGGSYFLTYHRWARKDQVVAAYPQFVEFLRQKLAHDPAERFQSEWYRHYRDMFAEELAAGRR
jgi:FAD/FMN-containing dehydrogenase